MPKPKTRVHAKAESLFDKEDLVAEKPLTAKQKREAEDFAIQADMTPEQIAKMNSLQMKTTSISMTEGLLFKLQRTVTHRKQTVARSTSASSIITEALQEYFEKHGAN